MEGEMAKATKGPGKSHRKGVTLLELGRDVPR